MERWMELRSYDDGRKREGISGWGRWKRGWWVGGYVSGLRTLAERKVGRGEEMGRWGCWGLGNTVLEVWMG